MKFSCSGLDLSDAASKVYRAASTKGLSPILEGIKITSKNGFVELVATDNELSIQKKIQANTLIDGQVVVPGKLFCEFIKKLIYVTVEISIDANLRMFIKYGDNQTEISCIDASEYPEIYQLDNAQQVVLIRSEFRDLIGKVEFCCSMDDSRPILKGVLLEIEQHNIVAVALDGYRLAKCIKPIEKTTAKMNAIVPRRSLLEIVRLVDDSADPLTVYIQKNYIMVDLEHTQIVSRLLDGDFVNYKQIIPVNTNTHVVVSREQLQDALERATILASKDKTNLVKFDIANSMLRIESNSTIGKVDEKLIITIEGPELKIAFNAGYFTQVLKVLTTQNINIDFINPTSPTIVRPSSSVDDVMFLVLPVRLM
jgi:DNA polymerase-3 subunit beta